MPRIRTIKPEFFTSEQIVECSTNARLLFIGMWCFADDNGIHVASHRRLKMEIFPGDPFTTADVEAMVEELIEAQLIEEYEVEGERYWRVSGWKKHQKIDRPNPKYPLPLGEQPAKPRRAIVEQSSSDHPRKGREKEGKGKGVGREGSAEGRDAAAETPPAPETPAKTAKASFDDLGTQDIEQLRGVLGVWWRLPESHRTADVRAAFEAWEVYRRQKGLSPWTPKGSELKAKEWSQYPPHQVAASGFESIKSEWQGYHICKGGKGVSTGSPATTEDEIEEELKRRRQGHDD